MTSVAGVRGVLQSVQALISLPKVVDTRDYGYVYCERDAVQFDSWVLAFGGICHDHFRAR
jgi:hypothetical protein